MWLEFVEKRGIGRGNELLLMEKRVVMVSTIQTKINDIELLTRDQMIYNDLAHQ